MERYYKELKEHYPYATLSMVERVKIYIAKMLYPDEKLQVALDKRILLGNFDDDPNAIKKSIDAFKKTNGQFPFTVYSIGENEPYEWKTNLQKNGNYYSEELEAYINFVPVMFTIPMVTFYTTPFDYWRARTVLDYNNSTLTRLNVPVIINDILTAFTIDLTFTMEKGALAFDIEQQFSYGKLYPIVHTIMVKGAFITVNIRTNYDDDLLYDNEGNLITDENGDVNNSINKPIIIYPVDDIIVQLWNYENKKNLKENILIDRWHSPDTPVVVSSLPINNSKNIPLSSNIQFNFNVPMNEQSVVNNLDFVPYFHYDYTWSNYSKTLNIIPAFELENSTEYIVLLNKKTKSGDDISLAEDFKLNFRTID